ncbi:MAG: ThiF family adenylyltransferase [Saprospiraceae bacterium]|jgi:molybdopterin/thiamine biosynthesis adenylyltransferase|nr:ThiF family adenylyltransferase [Saprospiraceae bacterium]
MPNTKPFDENMETGHKTKLALNVEAKRAWDQTFRLMSWWDSDKVAQARVMVVGAGALGNEVLKNLALLNVGNILIVDFDDIEYANLCRSVLFRESDIGKKKCDVAARRVRELNPGTRVQAINGDLLIDIGLGVFRRMDVIIGCLDNRLARMYINRYSFKTGKTWVDGAIENLAGQLDVFKAGKSCYECQLSDEEWKIIHYRLGCPDIAQRNTSGGKIPTTPISASIIAAMQVQEALKVIYGNEQQSMAGKHFKYDGMHNLILQYDLDYVQKEECVSHETIENLIEAPELSADNTVGELFDWATRRFGDERPILHLDYEVVLELTTEKSNITYPVLFAKPHFSDAEQQRYRKEPGENILYSKVVEHGLHKDNFPHLTASLRQIGVPPLQILKIEAGGSYHSVELTGDESFLEFQ